MWQTTVADGGDDFFVAGRGHSSEEKLVRSEGKHRDATRRPVRACGPDHFSTGGVRPLGRRIDAPGKEREFVDRGEMKNWIDVRPDWGVPVVACR